MSILFIGDYIDHFSATGESLFEHAKKISKKIPNTKFLGLSKVNNETYKFNNLLVTTIKIKPENKNNFFLRIFWNLLVCSKISLEIISSRKQFQYLYFCGTPQFLFYFVVVINFFLKKKLIFRTTDFFPETLLALNNNYIIKMLLIITNLLRKKIYKFSILGKDQKLYLDDKFFNIKKQLRYEKCFLEIPNIKKKIKSKIFLYSGTVGFAHDIDTLIKVFYLYNISYKQNYKIWINCTGSQKGKLIDGLKKLNIKFKQTHLLNKKLAGKLLAICDIHLILLKKDFSKIVLPSKYFCSVKSKNKIIFIGPKDSDIYRLGSTNNRFYHIENSNIIGGCNLLKKLINF